MGLIEMRSEGNRVENCVLTSACSCLISPSAWLPLEVGF